MTGPAVSFENNLGRIDFSRCLIGIGDTWKWDGGVAVHSKTIDIDGHLAQGDDGIEGCMSRRGPGKHYGQPGTLTLPWTTMEEIKLQELSDGDGVWLDMVPLKATFLDDNPDGHVYALHFFDLELYNPRLRLTPPSRAIVDEPLQMPWMQGVLIDPGNLRYGSMRTRQNEGMMQIELGGTLHVEGGTLPAGLVDKLTQRVGTEEYTPQNAAGLPLGYPNVFNLGDAIPEVRADLALEGVILIKSSIAWQVEQGLAQVQVNMTCQPQRIE